jgi:hypothetical protein
MCGGRCSRITSSCGGSWSAWKQVIIEALGWELTPANGERITREWAKWDRTHGFDYRCTAGIAHLSDQKRLEAGDEPKPGAPAPPYIDLLA